MQTIKLSRGKVALVDDADYEWLSKHKWCASFNKGVWYARRNVRNESGIQRPVMMHRVILGLVPGDGTIVDHADRDGLNNQRGNLRLATTALNGANRKLDQRNYVKASVYRGVTFNRPKKRWQARVAQEHVGCFGTQEEAAAAYNVAAREKYGQFAYQNEVKW